LSIEFAEETDFALGAEAQGVADLHLLRPEDESAPARAIQPLV
jgi:hypothetical protein